MTTHEDRLRQAEDARDELLAVAVDLARRLRSVSHDEAERAALRVNGTRTGLAGASRPEARKTAEVLSIVEMVLRGGPE